MKKILGILTVIFAAVFILIGCKNADKDLAPAGDEAAINSVKADSYTNLVDNDERNQLRAVMNSADLSNVDTFMNWVKEYNELMGDDGGMAKDWSPLNTLNYDTQILYDKWDVKYGEINDANCRITAFLLFEDKIKGDNTEESGSYTMMDVDKIENSEIKYGDLKKELGLYKTVFNEVSVQNATSEDEYHSAYPKKWAEKNVVFEEGKASIINVIMNDPTSKVLFIGHSGVLIDEDDYVLFIEKLAATMPYQVSKLADRKALSEMLLNRSEYTAGNEDCKTFILENNALMKVQ